MKKRLLCQAAIALTLLFGYYNVSFVETPISLAEIENKIDNKEDFKVLFIRNNCNHCHSLQRYISKSKIFHPFNSIYLFNISNYQNTEKDEERQVFFNNSKYEELNKYKFTPAIYTYLHGELQSKAVGFDSKGKKMAIDDGGGVIENMKKIKFWDYVEK